MAMTPELSAAQQLWVREILSGRREHRSCSNLETREKLEALEITAHDLLRVVKNVGDFAAACPRLSELEFLAEEVVRISIETDIEIPRLLRKIARDFDRGDENNEFERLYEDIRNGRYAPEQRR